MSHRDPLLELLEFATQVAFDAGRLTLRYFQTSLDIETKSDDTPVTRADRETEGLMRDAIERRFPQHAILGEEHGQTGPDGASVRWILDPIDGTRSFICGVPFYSVLIGVEVDGVGRVGVVHFPGLGDMLHAAQGHGAYWNGRRCHVSTTSRLADARLAITSENGFHRAGCPEAFERLRVATAMQRGWGDAYAHCLVATGRVDVAAEPIQSIWDSAPMLPLLTEAGGTYTDWTGTPRHDPPQCLSTNGALKEPMLALLYDYARSEL